MKNHFKRGSYFFILILCLFNIVTAFADVDAVDMWDEPRHQLLFSRGHVRLLLVNIPAGDTSLLHKHEFVTSYVLLEDASMTSRDADSEWSAPHQRPMREAGEIADRTDYYSKRFAHQVRNVSTNTFTVSGLVNTHPGQYRPTVKGKANHDLSLDNDWFREHRLELSVGEVSGELKFASPVLVIQVSRGSSEVLAQHNPKTIPGAWSYHEAGQTFQLSNSSDLGVRLVLLKVK